MGIKAVGCDGELGVRGLKELAWVCVSAVGGDIGLGVVVVVCVLFLFILWDCVGLIVINWV